MSKIFRAPKNKQVQHGQPKIPESGGGISTKDLTCQDKGLKLGAATCDPRQSNEAQQRQSFLATALFL